MKTNLFVGLSALVLAASGIILTFAPAEIAKWLGMGDERLAALSLQLLGAAQIGWAMTNWMSKKSLFGGIYGRPLVVGNLLHFFAGGTALLKSSASGPTAVIIAGSLYGLFAIGFGWVLFHNPLSANEIAEASSEDR